MGSIDDKRIKRAVKKLEKESKKTSEDLIYKPLKDLNHRDVEKRKDAVKSILVGVTLFPDPERKREVLEGLLGALEDKDTEVRGIAVEALQVMAVWHQQNTTETAPSNPEATSLQNSQGGGCPEGYMEAMRPIDETNRCSDQECPCPPAVPINFCKSI